LASFSRFSEYSLDLFQKKASSEAYALAVQADSLACSNGICSTPSIVLPAGTNLESAESALRIVMGAGVLPFRTRPGQFQPRLGRDPPRLRRENERERYPSDRPQPEEYRPADHFVVSNSSFPRALIPIAPDLIRPFVAENVLFFPRTAICARRGSGAGPAIDQANRAGRAGDPKGIHRHPGGYRAVSALAETGPAVRPSRRSA
jgi:hypothetical protein